MSLNATPCLLSHSLYTYSNVSHHIPNFYMKLLVRGKRIVCVGNTMSSGRRIARYRRCLVHRPVYCPYVADWAKGGAACDCTGTRAEGMGIINYRMAGIRSQHMAVRKEQNWKR